MRQWPHVAMHGSGTYALADSPAQRRGRTLTLSKHTRMQSSTDTFASLLMCGKLGMSIFTMVPMKGLLKFLKSYATIPNTHACERLSSLRHFFSHKGYEEALQHWTHILHNPPALHERNVLLYSLGSTCFWVKIKRLRRHLQKSLISRESAEFALMTLQTGSNLSAIPVLGTGRRDSTRDATCAPRARRARHGSQVCE